MQDFFVEQSNSGAYDIVIDEDAKDFKSVDGMETAIFYQLNTDKRATRFEVANARDRQGFIGDILTKESGYEAGSYVWLKRQSRNTQNDLNEVSAYAQKSLEYLVSIKAAESVSSEVINDNIQGKINIDNDTVNRFNSLWKNTKSSN
jgi:phage gp46-like protein